MQYNSPDWSDEGISYLCNLVLDTTYVHQVDVFSIICKKAIFSVCRHDFFHYDNINIIMLVSLSFLIISNPPPNSMNQYNQRISSLTYLTLSEGCHFEFLIFKQEMKTPNLPHLYFLRNFHVMSAIDWQLLSEKWMTILEKIITVLAATN